MHSEILFHLAGVVAGSVLGCTFGLFQAVVSRHNEKHPDAEELKTRGSPWFETDACAAYLLVILIAIQLICPVLLPGGMEWWASSGVLLGYGAVLFRQNLKARKPTQQ